MASTARASTGRLGRSCWLAVLGLLGWRGCSGWLAPFCSRSLAAAQRGPRVGRRIFQGTVLDPNYWQRQWFLAGDLGRMMPSGSKLVVVELLPDDNKNLAYLLPEGSEKLYRYIALAEGADLEGLDATQKALVSQSSMYTQKDAEFADWSRTGAKKSTVPKDTADVVLLGAGTVSKLGSNVERGLQEANRVLKPNGRVLLVLEQSEEEALGDLDVILEEQDRYFRTDEDEFATGKVLSRAGLQLDRLVRGQDCGLAIAMCSRAVIRKPAKASAARRKAPASGGARQRARRPGSTGKGRSGR